MSINKNSTDNIGGMQKLEYAFPEDISSITENESLMESSVVFYSGKSWQELYFTLATGQCPVTDKDETEGRIHITKVSCKHPKVDKTNDVLINNIKPRRFILRITDNNDVVRIFGNKESTLIMTASPSIEASPQSYNGWDITFAGEFAHAPFYESVLS